jgi:sarcosine oxidase, subunit gamma
MVEFLGRDLSLAFPKGEGIQIIAPPDRAIVHLKSWSLEPGPPSLVPPGLGGDLRVLNLGPGEWLAVSDVLQSPKLKESLDRHLNSDSIAATDISNGLKALRVEGPAARELLARGCGLDLDPEHFPAGRCTRTRFAQLAVVVHCLDAKPRFDLYAGRSFLPWLKSWLVDAAHGMAR